MRLTDKGRTTREPLQAMWSVLERTSAQGLDAEAVDTFITLAKTIEQEITDRDTTDETSR